MSGKTITLLSAQYMAGKTHMSEDLIAKMNELIASDTFTPEPWFTEKTELSASLRIVSSGDSNDGWIIGTLYGPDADANSRLVTNGQRMLAMLKSMTQELKQFLEWPFGREEMSELVRKSEELINQVEGNV